MNQMLNTPNTPNTPKITSEMMKGFKEFQCDCRGKIFHQGIVFKLISPILSTSGNEELYPVPVIICDNCGKIPSNSLNTEILSNDVLAKKPII